MHPITYFRLDENKNEAAVKLYSDIYIITKADFEQLDIENIESLDEDGYEKLLQAAERLSCIKKAFSHLSYSDMSSKKLQRKLAEKFDKNLAADVVALLIEREYLKDDELAVRYAKSFFEFKLWGPSRIRSDLYEKGFPAESINAALESIEGFDVKQNIIEILKKKRIQKNITDINEKKKLHSMLYRNGYSYSDINETLSHYFTENEDY